MLDLRDNDILLKMKEQLVQKEVKVEVKDIENKIKQIKIEVNTDNKINVEHNTNDKKLHNNIDKGVVMNKINNYKVIENRHHDIDLKDIKRGDIIWINLFGSVGSEQSSDEHGRPCICIQNDVGNAHSPTIIVSAITSQIKARLPIHVEIPSSEKYGLTKDSVVLLEQIRTVDKKRRILRKTGHLDNILMKKIDIALSISIGALKEKTPLERLSQDIQDLINDKLDDIRSIERTICTIVNNDEYLKNNLYGQRECYLASLERICKKYNLDYRDYYVMYKREKENDRIVV